MLTEGLHNDCKMFIVYDTNKNKGQCDSAGSGHKW